MNASYYRTVLTSILLYSILQYSTLNCSIKVNRSKAKLTKVLNYRLIQIPGYEWLTIWMLNMLNTYFPPAI